MDCETAHHCDETERRNGGGDAKSHSTEDHNQLRLRMLTYLSPGLPLELYQTYQYYLEESLGCETLLSVESRSSAPSMDRTNPFDSDAIDIGLLHQMCITVRIV